MLSLPCIVEMSLSADTRVINLGESMEPIV
jgi:hypothetical protein